jgi:hypothetical protein
MRMETSHDSEIRDIAALLISRYGERAASHASLQALKARRSGQLRHQEAWEWITDAVVQAMREES